MLRNRGDGWFDEAVEFPVEDGPKQVLAADLDRDRRRELVVVCHNAGSVLILEREGGGAYRTAARHAVGNLSFLAAAGDLDGAGDLDLITSGGEDFLACVRNEGFGKLAAGVPLKVDMKPNDATLADLDGDGDLDIAAACSGYQSPGSVTVLLNYGGGMFVPGARLEAGRAPMTVICPDLDGDGFPDICAANFYHGRVSVLMSSGDGLFNPAVQYAAGKRPYALAARDFDGDGDLDLAVAAVQSEALFVYLNDGAGGLSWPLMFHVQSAPHSIAAGDFDGDGRDDIAVANARSSDVWVFRNEAFP